MKRFSSVIVLSWVLFMPFLPGYAADSGQVSAPRFPIERYRVEGNTLLSVDELQEIFSLYTGKDRDFGTVQEALDTLEGEYRKRGYSTVQVVLPEQELERGAVLFRVVETRIKTVKVEGNRYFKGTNIRQSLPDLKEGLPPNIDRVSKNLRMANENPAKKVNLQLQGTEKENEIDAILKVVDEKPWKVSLLGDNTGTKQTGDARLGVLLQHANVADLDHVVTLMYTMSPSKMDKVGIYGASYHLPLYGFSDSIDLFGGYSDVNSGNLPMGTSNLAISGRGSVFGARYNQTLTRIGRYEHRLIYGMDYRDYRNNVEFSGIPLGSDVRVNPLSVAYNGLIQLSSGETGFNLALSRNVPLGGGGQDEDFNAIRSQAPAYYTIFRYGAHLAYALPQDWQIRMLFSGQYTDAPLIPGEQFGVGGSTTVRGFMEREVANDRGNLGSAEIYTPNLWRWKTVENSQCRFLAFYDIGEVSRVSPLPGEDARLILASAGLGVRVDIIKSFAMAVDYGYVLNPGGTQRRGDGRLHIRAVLTF